MIRIVKPLAPAFLLTRGKAAARELCEAFESAPDDYKSGAKTFDFDSSIYAAEEVKEALRDAQHKKCAFCESFVPHVSYGDVEHFRPKAGWKQTESDTLRRPGYYWLAYEWENLFYCCQLCNQRFKRNLFPLKDGRGRARSHSHRSDKEGPLLVDPSRLDPVDFIEFQEDRAHAVRGCQEGETTIEVLGLNRAELVEARGRRLETLQWLVLTRDLLRKDVATTPAPALSERLRVLKQKLRESRAPTSEYAAMARDFLNRPRPRKARGKETP